ncbi:putative WD40/YVTN repeat-like-containing domain superfamily, WD40-repeat-containing [Plasmopara halstedii]
MTIDQEVPAVKPLPTDVESRERIPGTPLIPGGAAWSEDGRLAVVSDSSILVATFRSRELEMYQPYGPAVSKDFVFLPKTPINEHVPVAIPRVIKSLDAGLPQLSTTYLLLNESDRHQHNPKELSLSKNAGAAFIAAEWGPRGSAPNNSCALLALTASSRLSLHFPSSFHMNWSEVAVLSENLFTFFQRHCFRLGPSHDNRSTTIPPSTAMATPRGDKKIRTRKMDDTVGSVAVNSIAEYTHQCALLSTLTMAWSPFMVTVDKQVTTSLIALSGRKVSTIWAYMYRSFVEDHESEPFLSTAPIAWIDTDKYGWVSTSAWQKMHQYGTAFKTQKELGLALGTSEGSVLIVKVPVTENVPNDSPQELTIERVIVAPSSQPIYGLCMGSHWTFSDSPTNDLIVASGSTISVWNLKKKKQTQPNVKWNAHEGNITGLDIDYFGDAITSAAVDGTIKVWSKTGQLVYSSDAVPPKSEIEDSGCTTTTTAANSGKYPVFGLALSPSSALLACLFVVPPASRPNRKSQADVSYSRVSSSLEYIPLPWVKNCDQMIEMVCRILNESQSVSNFMDVAWLCYNDNAAIMSCNGSSSLDIPSVLNKFTNDTDNSNVLAPQPIYLHLCQELEKIYDESTSTAKQNMCLPIPLYLQASVLLRSAVTPADHLVAAHNLALVKLRRTLGVYWATRCLTALVAAATKKNKVLSDHLNGSPPEIISALIMADFLSVQDPLTSCHETLVTQIYTQLDSPDHAAVWIAYVKAKANEQTADEIKPAVPIPPSRETCFICQKSVPFGELEILCASRHILERCFLSFRCISAMEVWKCMGCGASASEFDTSGGTTPFFLLDSNDHDDEAAASRTKVICRLCGSYCRFLRY